MIKLLLSYGANIGFKDYNGNEYNSLTLATMFKVYNNIHIESKGYLSDNAERQKYILIKKQNPNLDLRFVFLDEDKLCGGMKTTHGEWAKKHGFLYCSIKDYDIIKEWLNE